MLHLLHSFVVYVGLKRRHALCAYLIHNRAAVRQQGLKNIVKKIHFVEMGY